MRGWVLVVACGCGRIGFDGLGSGDDSAPLDAADLDRDYPSFETCPPELVLLGQAQCNGGALELTPDVATQKGAAWIKSPFPTNRSFSIQVTFAFVTAAIPGDGAAIVMQNDPAGTASIGVGGASLGFRTITPSVALELDTYPNALELNGEHVGIDIDGAINELSADAKLAPFSLSDGMMFTAWLDYDAATQTVRGYVDRTSTKPATELVTTTNDLAHLGGEMWIGVTASTGSSSEVHRVLAWKVDVR